MSCLLSQRVLVAMLIGILAAAVSGYAQTTWYVDDDAPGDPGAGDPTVSDPNEDGSAAHPFDAIQEGINAAVNGDAVLVLDGTYTGAGNRDLDFGGRLITVRSDNGPGVCLINCEASDVDPHRGLYFHTGETYNAVVHGLTILNGHVNESSPGGSYGGGIYCDNANPIITECQILYNAATRGGGLAFRQSNATITRSFIGWNTAALDGGGIYGNVFGPWNEITTCAILGNTAGSGAGIYGAYFQAPITNCTIAKNIAIGGNSARGGGLYLINYSYGPITNTAIIGNAAVAADNYGDGGALWCSNTDRRTLTNCTISGNRTDGNPFAPSTPPRSGAFWCEWAPLTIINSIIWDNGDYQPMTFGVGSTPSITYCDVAGGWSDTGNINLNPQFVDVGYWDDNGTPTNPFDDFFAGGDYRLLPGSPCLDAASNLAVPLDAIDLDGDGDTSERMPLDLVENPRFVDDPNTIDTGVADPPDYPDVVDMGAVEFVPTQLVSTEPPADGSLPKTQNNIIVCTFDAPVTLPASGNPLVITELAYPNNDVSSSFSYSVDPNDTGDPTGATLKATETGAVLTDLTWYHVASAPGWANVVPFEFDVCTLRGDANNSARVTTADYSEIKAHLGERTDARYDLNGSARITTADYSVVKANMGHRAPAKP